MPTRQEILKDITQFSAAEIAEVIKSGDLTMYELKSTGRLTPLMKRKLEAILDGETTPAQTSVPSQNEALASRHKRPADMPVQETVTVTPEAAGDEDEGQWMSWDNDDGTDSIDSVPPADTESKEETDEPTDETETSSEHEVTVINGVTYYPEPPMPEDEAEAEDTDTKTAVIAASSIEGKPEAEQPQTEKPRNEEPEVEKNGSESKPETEPETIDETGARNNHRLFAGCMLYRGRIGRVEYIISIMMAILLFSGLEHISIHYFYDEIINYGLLPLYGITIWFLTSQTARRCHDINIRGWIMLTMVFPLILIFLPGNKGTNRFGTTTSI